MATYHFHAYAASALTYDPKAHTVTLRADFDPARDRISVAITDDDRYFSGDFHADELGSDANQTATVTRMDGTVVASGRIYDEEFSALRHNGGKVIEVDRIEIGGVNLGYFATSPLTPGVAYSASGPYNVSESDNTALTYGEIQSVPCFARGTLIATERGEVRIERIGEGDRVLTLDNGYQPVLWIGRFGIRDLSSGDAPAQVTFPVGSLGPGLPQRPLTVTASHRMLLCGADLEYHVAAREALAAAGHLAPAPAGHVACAFHHLLLPRHELVLSNGVWSESLFAGGSLVSGMAPPLQALIRALAGDGHEVTARPCLTRREVTALGRRHRGAALLAA
ncbi:Hint domain-containing protein [Albidovulum sp.]|uniref:Hint domain-containing protein n=1 Tax=Albidovulum sp. TaxID=1872424 RepID=UPI001DAC1D07|nr:Hint domain-containing protein [Paracoccaceae bacterium]